MLTRSWLIIALTLLALAATSVTEAQSLRRNNSGKGKSSVNGRSSGGSQKIRSSRRSAPTRSAAPRRAAQRSSVRRAQPARRQAPRVQSSRRAQNTRRAQPTQRAQRPRVQPAPRVQPQPRNTVRGNRGQVNRGQVNRRSGSTLRGNNTNRNQINRNQIDRQGAQSSVRRSRATTPARPTPSRLQRDPHPSRTAAQRSRATGQRATLRGQPTGRPRTVRPSARSQSYNELVRNSQRRLGRSGSVAGRPAVGATGATPFGAGGRVSGTDNSTNNGTPSLGSTLRRDTDVVKPLRGSVSGNLNNRLGGRRSSTVPRGAITGVTGQRERRGSISGVTLNPGLRGSITGQAPAESNGLGAIVAGRTRRSAGITGSPSRVALRNSADAAALGRTVGTGTTGALGGTTPRAGLSLGSVVRRPVATTTTTRSVGSSYAPSHYYGHHSVYYPFGHSHYGHSHYGHSHYGHSHYGHHSAFHYPYWGRWNCHWLWSSYFCHSSRYYWSPRYRYASYRYGYSYAWPYYRDCDDDRTTIVYVESAVADDADDSEQVRPRTASAPYAEVDLAFCQGWIQLGLGDYEAASLSFDRARRASPASGLVHLFSGLAFAGQGEYPLAAASFEEAYRLDPTLVVYGWEPVAHFGSVERYGALLDGLREYRTASPASADGWLVTAWLELLTAHADGADLAPVKRAAGELVLYGQNSALAAALLDEVSRREQEQPLPSDFPLSLRLDAWLLAPSCEGIPGLEL